MRGCPQSWNGRVWRSLEAAGRRSRRAAIDGGIAQPCPAQISAVTLAAWQPGNLAARQPERLAVDAMPCLTIEHAHETPAGGGGASPPTWYLHAISRLHTSTALLLPVQCIIDDDASNPAPTRLRHHPLQASPGGVVSTHGASRPAATLTRPRYSEKRPRALTNAQQW